ncbi:MAG: MATE family efflux transporter [Butyrivibrio sp.]
MKVNSLFFKYVLQNILGMLGISAYVLADTFFISRAEGTAGLTALNLVLPLYSLIFAVGSMIGVGSATKFKIQSSKKEPDSNDYFGNAIIFALLFSVIFVVSGLFFPDKIMALLGGDDKIIRIGTPYTRIFMSFAPFFMMNYIFNAFIRNDNAPSLAMAAILSSSLFNIVMDYVLMFPLKMGMSGAALATAFSPVVGITICSFHFFSKKNHVRFKPVLSFRKLFHSGRLGIAAFIGELSSGVTTAVFNFLILGLGGNEGVAAYGVVANTAIVATAVFNGVSQGSQPLFSEYYGMGNRKNTHKILKLSIITALLLSVLIIGTVFLVKVPVINIFNSENNAVLFNYAIVGLPLYFTGFIFAGFNIVGTGYLSATDAPLPAFITSVLRGIVAITLCAFTMSYLFGMTGIWLAFPAAELITSLVMIAAIIRSVRSR